MFASLGSIRRPSILLKVVSSYDQCKNQVREPNDHTCGTPFLENGPLQVIQQWYIRVSHKVLIATN